MSFRITGLSPDLFRPLFGLSDADLLAHGAKRYVADASPGYPDRIELRDAEPGETLILVNHVHQPANTPYRASHAVFVREGAQVAYDQIDAVPRVLQIRPISLRAFNSEHDMVEGELAEGRAVEDVIAQFLANPHVDYIHAHYARRGCYAARVDRA